MIRWMILTGLLVLRVLGLQALVTPALVIPVLILPALVFEALAVSPEAFAQQPAPNCQFFKVKVASLNVSAEPRGDATYIDVLDNGEVACVTVMQRVNDRDWSYIVYVSKGGNRRNVGGWANQQGLQRVSGSDSIAAPAPDTRPAATPPSPAPATADNGEDMIQWGVPIASGPYPIAGQTIEQLAQRTPLFSPFEGLEERYWKKECKNCHEWTRDSLCTQGQAYIADLNKLLRIKHPYGGPFKLAILRWAKEGCP